MKGHKRIERQISDQRIDEIVKLKIRGEKIEHIAEKVALSKSAVHRLMQTDVAKLKMEKTRRAIAEVADEAAQRASDDVQKSIEDRIKAAASSALTVMVEKLDSENEFVQVKAASDLMDRDQRMSKTKNTKIQGGVLHAFVTPEQLISAARTARELQSIGVSVPALPINAEMLGLDEEEAVANAGTD